MEIVLGKMAGFCGGVRNAVNKTYKEAEGSGKTTYCLGDLVHNPVVLSNLEKLGVKIVNSLEEVPNPKGKTVIIRAHGVAKGIYSKAKQMEITLKDLTCPKVLKIHDFVEEYAKNGDYIFFIGEKKHPEVIGTASFCGKNSTIIEKEEDLEEALNIIKKECEEKSKENIYNIEIKKNTESKMEIENSSSKKLVVVAQTTFNLEKFKKFENRIREELENKIELIINNTICDATRLRQEETEKLSKEVEGMIVIGGKKSSNTNKLYQISLNNCSNVIMVENEEELVKQLEKFKNCNKVGVMAGASTPEETINKVISILKDA